MGSERWRIFLAFFLGVKGLKIVFPKVSKMEIEATKESILAALDDYHNEHLDPVNYMFEEFKVIED